MKNVLAVGRIYDTDKFMQSTCRKAVEAIDKAAADAKADAKINASHKPGQDIKNSWAGNHSWSDGGWK